MREPILKAVAAPPRLFWAPFLPALTNIAIQFPMMFIIMGIWTINPLMFVPSIIALHFMLVIYGVREPHLSAMMQAQGPLMGGSKNMHPSKGTKLSP